jgi:hypothetical protein
MKTVVKMLVMVLLFKACPFAFAAAQNPRPIYLAVIVDASPASDYKWGQIKLFAARTLQSLGSGDRLEIYSARKDSVLLHTSSTIQQTSDAVVLRCIDDIDRIFFLDRADTAKAAELVFEAFKAGSRNFDCGLLIISDGQMSAGHIRQIRRVLSAYKMRNWPVMFATFEDADKDIFRASAKNEFTVTLIRDEGLKSWLDTIRTQFPQLPTSESKNTGQGQSDTSAAVTSKRQESAPTPVRVQKNETDAPSSEKPAAKPLAGREINTPKKDGITTAEQKQLSADTGGGIDGKNPSTVILRIELPQVSSPAAASDSNTAKVAGSSKSDTNNAKTATTVPDINRRGANKPDVAMADANKPDANKLGVRKVNVNKPDVNNVAPDNAAQAKVPSAGTAVNANQTHRKSPLWLIKIKSHKKIIMFSAGLLIILLIILYIYRKVRDDNIPAPDLPADQQEKPHLKLMAVYNGATYDLGDIHTISSLEIGAHPGSTIPIESEGVDGKLFAIRMQKGAFHIKNLSGRSMTIGSVPLASSEKRRLILPADIRYGDTVSIQLFELSQEKNDSNQPQLQKETI